MKCNVSVEDAVNFVRMSVFMNFSWPLPVTATKVQKIKNLVLWLVVTLNIACHCLSLLSSIYVNLDDSFIVMSSTCYAVATGACILKSITSRLHRNKMQLLILEMEKFFKIAKPTEQTFLDNYVKRCWKPLCGRIIINYLTGFYILCTPLFHNDRKFPTSAIYPFQIDRGWIKILVYFHQSFSAIQCAAGASIGCQVSLLLWFVGSRLEMLASEFHKIRKIRKFTTHDHLVLRKIVKKHRDLIRFANEATDIMSNFVFVACGLGCIGVVLSCLIIVGNYSLAAKIQFGPMALISGASLFACAWPADNLIDACHLVGTAAYNSAWPEMSPQMRKNLLIVIQRSQRPIVVSIGGFIPSLSLRYYGCFVTAAASYLMTLRATIKKNEY